MGQGVSLLRVSRLLIAPGTQLPGCAVQVPAWLLPHFGPHLVSPTHPHPGPTTLAFSVTQHVLLRPTAGPLLFSTLREDPSHGCFSSSFQDQLKYLSRGLLDYWNKELPPNTYTLAHQVPLCHNWFLLLSS